MRKAERLRSALLTHAGLPRRSSTQDFAGFRVLVILPRYKSTWPPPGGYAPGEQPKSVGILGGPKEPLPVLQACGKPLTAATIRTGPGYLEIPFVATHENKRGRGYCRCGPSPHAAPRLRRVRPSAQPPAPASRPRTPFALCHCP